MKVCTKCGEVKSIAEFSKRSSARDGLRTYCKVCERISFAQYCAANPEKEKTRKAKYRAVNSEKEKAYKIKWRAANPEKVKSAKAKSQAKNPEKSRMRNSKWKAANTEKVRISNSKWQAENPEKMRAYNAKYRASHPEVNRIKCHNYQSRKRENGGKLSKDIAERLHKLQRGKCACCGQPLGDDFHLDHIMPLALGGPNIDSNIQLLRATCNIRKRHKHPVDFMQMKGFLL